MSVKAGIGWMYRMKGLWDRTELMIAWEANGVAWKRIFEIRLDTESRPVVSRPHIRWGPFPKARKLGSVKKCWRVFGRVV